MVLILLKLIYINVLTLYTKNVSLTANAELVSLVGMLNELIDTQDGFKVIPDLGKNEIIEYIISISTISLS